MPPILSATINKSGLDMSLYIEFNPDAETRYVWFKTSVLSIRSQSSKRPSSFPTKTKLGLYLEKHPQRF